MEDLGGKKDGNEVRGYSKAKGKAKNHEVKNEEVMSNNGIDISRGMRVGRYC